jgi:two-component system, chemotaxis family, sensor kinase CheA
VSDDFDFSSGMPSDEMAQYLQMFVDETSEQLDALVDVLLVLESNPSSHNELNESFRLIHSIKGAAAMMGLDSITLLTHHLENYFERLRAGIQQLDRPMMQLILKCVDFLREATVKLRDGEPLSSSPELLDELVNRENLQEASAAVESSSDSRHSTEIAETVEPIAVVETAVEETAAEADQASHSNPLVDKRLIIYFDRKIELPELKAELILARVRELAEITRLSPAIQDIASLVELRTLQIWVRTVRSDAELRAVAEVVGVELLEIDAVESESSDLVATDAVGLSPAVVAPGLWNEISIAPAAANAFTAPTEPVSSVDVPTHSSDGPSKVAETVRVDIQRLDKLMNLAGELVVNRARFVQIAQQMSETFKKSGLLGSLRDLCDQLQENLLEDSKTAAITHDQVVKAEKRLELQMGINTLQEQLQVLEHGRRSFLQLNEAIDHFSRVSDGLQRGVLDTRMVPVGPLFNRFKRTVRDISGELNKSVNLVIHGEKTELDKRMIDELGDPLVHLVRNAIDHGLESEDVRKSRGKPVAGTLTLEAVHSGNNVLIYVRDDGGGINVEKIKKRVLERGIATSSELEHMSDHEISQFIWSPGFSTAEVVSDISGRGVGMDIVKTRIRELSGTIEVHSVFGQGTTFVIRLPLTLAIIRSLLFQLNEGMFAAPIENVREIVSVRDRDIISVHGRNSIEVRGEFIPLIDIEDVFDWHKTRYAYEVNPSDVAANESDNSSVIILSTINKKMGLSVSALRGCENLVVKSLDENFTHIQGLAGASILGDGSVCLLLDIVSCVDLAQERLRDRKRVARKRIQPSS